MIILYYKQVIKSYKQSLFQGISEVATSSESVLSKQTFFCMVLLLRPIKLYLSFHLHQHVYLKPSIS